MGGNDLPKTDVLIGLELSKSVCFATQQNGVGMLKSLSVCNNTDRELTNIRIRLSGNPQFFEPVYVAVPLLAPGEEHVFGGVEILPDFEFLASVTERIKAEVVAECEVDGQPLRSECASIQILAFDEWTGMGTTPELLACFSTPRDPAVNSIISEASQLLKKEGLSFDGYQSCDPNIVNKQLAAIFSVIKSRNIAYGMPPASFEQNGQKIRLPSAVAALGLGTCLDTTMLFCACAEAVGINPVVYIFASHAFVGFWLKDAMFGEVIGDDLSLVNKRTADGISELIGIETTLVTNQKSTYAEAQAAARSRLANGKGFICYIDIARARKSGILPLPIRFEGNGNFVVDRTLYTPERESVQDMRIVDGELAEAGLRDRLEKWQRDLLDVTLRNPLVNFRINKTGIPLINSDLEAVEDAFVSGKQFRILPYPVELGQQINDITKAGIGHEGRTGDIIKNDFQAGIMRSALKEEDLTKRLTTLYRNGQSVMQETGASTLYLALGFLKWQETEKPDVDRFAPILLLPIELTRKSASAGYRISLREDENQANLSLIEMLRVNFKIDASGLKELPQGECGVDVRQVLTYVRKLIIGQKGWDVVEACSLGVFQFAKFVLWNDLKTREQMLRKHPLTSALIDAQNIPALYEPAFESDGRLYLPLDSDSSQTEAVKAASSGSTFVLHGPPGTGKSQVITNIIADALAHNRRVLFIAEKVAALDVVKRRLDKLGIGEFCLELHSNKSQKRGFYEQFDKLLELADQAKDVCYDDAAAKLSAATDELTATRDALFKKRGVGKSVFSGLNQLLGLCGGDFSDEELIEIAVTDITESQYDEGIEILKPMLHIGAALGEPIHSAFYGCDVSEYSFELRDKVLRLTKALSESFTGFSAALTGLKDFLGQFKIKRKPVNIFSYAHTRDLHTTLGELFYYKQKSGFVKFFAGLFSKRFKSMKRSVFHKKMARFVKEMPDEAAMIYNALDMFVRAEAELNAALSYGERFHSAESWGMEIYSAASGFSNYVATLRDVCIYNSYRHKAAAFPQFNEVIQLYQSGELQSGQVFALWERSFWYNWLRREVSSDALLNGFSPSEHSVKCERYKALVQHVADLAQKEVYLKLAARLPNFRYAAQGSSEPAILLKAVKNRGRGMTIRQIFGRVPELLSKVKPCMLMSPISAAQYLPENFPAFDLVVFDEASQLQTCEAAGAIARGQSAVVVGDPNQLPPTTFFSSKSDDDETDIEFYDLESVLDDMLTLSVPERRLLWHYRSAHESLIAYSNINYYDNRLVTFPTPDDAQSRVEFRKVDGVYDRGTTRTNKQEAEAVVNELFACLSDPETSKLSYGVVTFNINQQNLIQDLVDKRLAKQPALEKYFSAVESPVFIKNIENVQGDERDVIIFSVTYGPDKDGKMTVNFGPVNKEGGWRRLNVAITRACQKIIVFSTVTPDMIDLSRTAAKGVQGLKGFLSFALNPRTYLTGADRGVRSDTALVSSVAAALRREGYRVTENLGRSRNKIDIAVQAGDGRYMLGILCDNEASGTTDVRDREYGNENFLRRAGWNLTRVYALEWWQNKRGELARLVSLLEGGEHVSAATSAADALKELQEQQKEIAFNPQIPLPSRPYEMAQLPQNTPENFLLYGNIATVTEQIKAVISAEAPLTEARLFKAVASAWDIPRMMQKHTEHLAAIVKRVNPVVNTTQATKFYWNNKADMAMTKFRAPSDRKADEIPKEEYAVAAHYIMQNALSIGHEDLVRETAKLFGFAKTPVASMRIDLALSLLSAEGKIRKEDSIYRFIR